MNKIAARLIGTAIASQLVCACASPQLVSYQLEDSTQRHLANDGDDYLPKVVVKSSAKSTRVLGRDELGRTELGQQDERFDIRYYQDAGNRYR